MCVSEGTENILHKRVPRSHIHAPHTHVAGACVTRVHGEYVWEEMQGHRESVLVTQKDNESLFFSHPCPGEFHGVLSCVRPKTVLRAIALGDIC